MSAPDNGKSHETAGEERRIGGGSGTHVELERLDPDLDVNLDLTLRGAAAVSAPTTVEQLYPEHFDFVFRTLRHLGVPDAALADAVQEVWLAVHRQLSTFEGRSTHRTWLFSIALNVARQQRRWQRRHGERLTALPDDLPDERPWPDQVQAGREAFGLVREFLATLDEPRRVLFISQLLEELKAEETAQLLGIEPRLVYSRVRDLRRAFKRWLLERQGAQ